MGVYVSPADCHDPAFTVDESHCAWADVRVRTALLARAVTPQELDSIALPNAALAALGRAYACAQAALEASVGSDVLLSKHQAYSAQARDLAAAISRDSLGLAQPAGPAPGHYGTIEIERG